MSGPPRPSPTCRGVTAAGVACQRQATNPSGWCGVCIGVPGPQRSPDPAVRAGTPPDPLGDPHGWVDQLDPVALQRLAANRGTSVETIRRLAADQRALRWVAEVLAQRDDTPPDVLSAAYWDIWEAGDDGIDVEVGVDLASHQNAPPELFEALTRPEALDADGDAEIARAAASNPNCPPGVLARLAGDRWVAEVVAGNPSCPTGTLHDLASGGDEATAAAVAANPACPPQLLDDLADPDFGDHITSAVASNPSCPPGTLERLAGDPRSGPATLAAVAAHPGCPPAARAAAGLLAG